MYKTILVADDEAHILHVVSMKLQNAGYRVLTATDGQEALQLCLADPPDLVITDYQMPSMTGLELLRQLRLNSDTENIPAVMLTARGFDIPPDEIVAAGITTVISKPFSPRNILAVVNELLGLSQAANTEAS